MPRVTLREYLNQIEGLIDENLLAEAATHCRHILQQYPRHVETYRLLGRVLLEQQKYSETIDVFERVASADPEDMIVQAGLALAYKENLDLPRAVWHMERAFELDPYNRAIQDELSELYAARDGYTRDRIDLNRAALARLYFRSAMYGKAAAELTRLLKEKPKRLDLQILLADALFWQGGRSDLVEVCLGIVEEMPYCIKANAILAAAWMRSGRPMEAEEHWRRVQSLTLLTARSVDPDSTLGRVLRLGDGLEFPQEVIIEDLDEIAATTRQGDDMDDLAEEKTGDPTSGDQIPGWLHEIGFTAEEQIDSENEEELAFQSIPEPLDDDWLDEVALAAGIGLAVEESLKDDSKDEEFYSDELVSMGSDVESEEPESVVSEVEPDIYGLLEDELNTIAAVSVASESESIEEDAAFEDFVSLDDDLAYADESVADVVSSDIDVELEELIEAESSEIDVTVTEESQIGIEPEVLPPDQSSEAILDEGFSTEFWEEPVISSETGQISEEYSDLQEDMTDLVEELQAQRRKNTSLLPDLDEVLEEQRKGSDWLDDLADDSDVTEDLPEWLYETVGFTDQLTDLPEEESAEDIDFEKTASGERAENADFSETGDIAASDVDGIRVSEQIDWDSEWPDIEDAAEEDDLPGWLLDANEVLEELPDEMGQASQDSWLQNKGDSADAVRWLDELAPKEKDTTAKSSAEKLVLHEEPPTPPTDDMQEILDDAGDIQEEEIRWPSTADDEQDDNAAAENSDDGG